MSADDLLALIEQGKQMAAHDTKIIVACIPILEYVSRGKGYVGVEPYPDASARRVLGMIRDGLEP